MNFRSNGARLLATRTVYDKVMDAVRFENVGFISKQNLSININEKFQLSQKEIDECAAAAKTLEHIQNLREEIALCTLQDTIELVARYLARKSNSPEINDLAYKVSFHAEELKRIARRHQDSAPSTPVKDL